MFLVSYPLKICVLLIAFFKLLLNVVGRIGYPACPALIAKRGKSAGRSTYNQKKSDNAWSIWKSRLSAGQVRATQALGELEIRPTLDFLMAVYVLLG